MRLEASSSLYWWPLLMPIAEPEIVGDFLEPWPTLQKVQKARPQTVRNFFIQHHSCRSDSIDRRLEQIRRALPAVNDAAVTQSCSVAVAGFVRVLRELRDAISSYDKQIETLTRQHPISRSSTL